MIESILKKSSVKIKITVKVILSLAFVIAAAFLPLLVHATIGSTGGTIWLPMYIPVLLGGCLLGGIYGSIIGACSPIASYFISQAILGSPMPSLAKLPFMIAELAIFGIISGMFSKKIYAKPFIAFPAVLAAQIAGRVFNLGLNILVISLSGKGKISPVFSSAYAGFPGLYVQAIMVPLIIIALALFVKNEKLH